MSGVHTPSPIEGPLPDLPAQREAFITYLEQTWEGDPDAETRIQQGIAQFDVATDPCATPIDLLHAGLPSETDPEDFDTAPLSRSNKLILGGMLVTMAATGMAHATDKQPEKSQPRVQVSSVQLALQSQSIENALFEATKGNARDNAQAKSSVLTASGGNPELKQKIAQAVDLARVQNAIQRGKYYPEETASIISAIEDPTQRTVAETTLYTFAVDEVFWQVVDPRKDDKLAISTARKLVDKQMPESAAPIRDHAMDALDKVAARDTIDEFSVSPMDTTDRLKAWAAAEELVSPEKRQQLRRMTESLIVADALQDLYEGKKIGKDLEALASEITNDTMRGVLLQYSDGSAKAEARGYGAWLREKVLEESITDFSPHGGPLALDVQIAQYIRSQTLRKADDARNAAEASLGEALGAQTGLRPAPSAPELSQEADPYEIVDLSGVVPLQKVPNRAAEMANRQAGAGELATPNHYQFGEVSVVDGKLTLSFQDGLNDKLRQQFAQAVESNRPLLEAAFAGGNLVSMRFVLAYDFDPYYLPTSREGVMVLAADGYLTADQLSSVLTHETTHSLFRDYFSGIKVSPDEHKVLASACANLQKATYREIGAHLNRNPELLTNLRAALNPEHASLADFLVRAAEDGSMDQLLNGSVNIEENTYLNQCVSAGNSGEFFGRAVNAAGLGTQEFNGDLRYIRFSPAMGQLVRSIDKFVREGSLYGRVVNEAGYVMTDSPDRHLLGHGEDNANETYASLMNAALNYPGGLQVKLAGLGMYEREAIKHILDTEWDAAAARYPSLQPLFDRARTVLNIKK